MKKQLMFGAFPAQIVPFKELVKRWKFCEEVGFDSIWVADHFAHWNKGLEPFWESWAILAAIACYTSKIRFGTMVTNMTWRHPAWLARQALTIDHISNGRLEIGLGAGRHGSTDQKMIVVDDWSTKERVERFREYIEIIDLLLRNPVTTYTGKYYHINEAYMSPESVQKPRPPLLIGTRGTKMLKIVAQFADTWNCMAFFGENMEDKNHELLKEKNKLLDKYCLEIGRDTKEIRRSLLIYETKGVYNLSSLEIYTTPGLLEDIVKKYTKIGFNEIIIPYPMVKKEIPMFEKIAREVIPELRKKYG